MRPLKRLRICHTAFSLIIRSPPTILSPESPIDSGGRAGLKAGSGMPFPRWPRFPVFYGFLTSSRLP